MAVARPSLEVHSVRLARPMLPASAARRIPRRLLLALESQVHRRPVVVPGRSAIRFSANSRANHPSVPPVRFLLTSMVSGSR
jgi:hypothetical protein